MVDNSNMPHPKCLGSQKNPGTEPKTCEKGPKLGFEYLPTSKTLHCERTACALRAWHSLKCWVHQAMHSIEMVREISQGLFSDPAKFPAAKFTAVELSPHEI